MPDSPPPPDRRSEAARQALRELGSLDLEAVEVTGSRTMGQRPALLDVQAEDPPGYVTVVLRHHGRRVEATEEGSVAPHRVERTASRATIAALRQLLPERVAELHLDVVDVIDPATPNRPAVVHCAVALRTASGEDLLVGSAVVRGTDANDDAHAAARAVLDAVNRRFSELTGG
jgi:hypothetical protein